MKYSMKYSSRTPDKEKPPSQASSDWIHICIRIFFKFSFYHIIFIFNIYYTILASADAICMIIQMFETLARDFISK